MLLGRAWSSSAQVYSARLWQGTLMGTNRAGRRVAWMSRLAGSRRSKPHSRLRLVPCLAGSLATHALHRGDSDISSAECHIDDIAGDHYWLTLLRTAALRVPQPQWAPGNLGWLSRLLNMQLSEQHFVWCANG